jgi:hypothetical protein
MTHAVIAANLILALGGKPDITSPDKIFKYPGSLPGNIIPGLTLSFGPLTKQ